MNQADWNEMIAKLRDAIDTISPYAHVDNSLGEAIENLADVVDITMTGLRGDE